MLFRIVLFSCLIFTQIYAKGDPPEPNENNAISSEQARKYLEGLEQSVGVIRTCSPTLDRLIPLILALFGLTILLGLYVYDVVNDLIDEGGLRQWKNDTISQHCSDTSTNQFKMLFFTGFTLTLSMIWLMSLEKSYRWEGQNWRQKLWYVFDLLAACMFVFVGVFPSYGKATIRIGCPDEPRAKEGEKSRVNGKTMLYLFTFKTCINRTASLIIHFSSAMIMMIELAASNFIWTFFFLANQDKHTFVFQVFSCLTIACLVSLIFFQMCLRLIDFFNDRRIAVEGGPEPTDEGILRPIFCLFSMAAEFTGLFSAVGTMIMAILHRDDGSAWAFSYCVGIQD